MTHLARGAWSAAALAMSSAAAAQGPEWTTLARSAARESAGGVSFAQFAQPRWVASVDELGRTIVFEGQSTPVTFGERVFALGRSGGQSRLFCIDAISGQVRWGAPVPPTVLESWASPTVDGNNTAVLIASGRFLTAIHAISGDQLWQTELSRNVAGATPAVTTDLGPGDRAFVTDYDGFGGAGSLYCINIDAGSPANPFLPGQIVWSVTLGTTGANSPAYANGRVYVASVSDPSGASPGIIRAFDAIATTPPLPLWTFTNTESHGFYGGVSVVDGGIYAASYAFAGGIFAANLVKLNASTGALAWSAPCNRTDTIPIRLPDSRVAVSGGIRGFGTLLSIQVFRDDGTAAVLDWDSAVHSWVDSNQNQLMDPGEFIDVGGWTVQPAQSDRDGTPVLFAGVLPTGPSTAGACAAMLELDLSRVPSDPHFIRDGFAGAGSSPALASRGLYTLGPAGLHAFGPAPCIANCDQSMSMPMLTANDFVCFLNLYSAADPRANCDESVGTPDLTANDFLCYLNKYAAGCP